jgi:hypothetical protein
MARTYALAEGTAKSRGSPPPGSQVWHIMSGMGSPPPPPGERNAASCEPTGIGAFAATPSTTSEQGSELSTAGERVPIRAPGDVLGSYPAPQPTKSSTAPTSITLRILRPPITRGSAPRMRRRSTAEGHRCWASRSPDWSADCKDGDPSKKDKRESCFRVRFIASPLRSRSPASKQRPHSPIPLTTRRGPLAFVEGREGVAHATPGRTGTCDSRTSTLGDGSTPGVSGTLVGKEMHAEGFVGPRSSNGGLPNRCAGRVRDDSPRSFDRCPPVTRRDVEPDGSQLRGVATVVAANCDFH